MHYIAPYPPHGITTACNLLHTDNSALRDQHAPSRSRYTGLYLYRLQVYSTIRVND